MAVMVSANPNYGPGTQTRTCAESGITARIDGNGNSARISVTVDGVRFTFPNRPVNNAENVYTTDCGIVVSVFVRGNSIMNTTVVMPAVEVVEEEVTPIEVALGFIGHYLHDGRVLTTSFYWQTLNAGDMIDWDAVEAAYAAWVAIGGLAPDTANGWRTSGFGSFAFADGAEIGHGDFSEAQLEGYYRAYFVATGYVLPVEEEEEEIAVIFDCDFCEDAGCCECDCDCVYTCECGKCAECKPVVLGVCGCGQNCQGNRRNMNCCRNNPELARCSQC
jgi:hypothetical protein